MSMHSCPCLRTTRRASEVDDDHGLRAPWDYRSLIALVHEANRRSAAQSSGPEECLMIPPPAREVGVLY
jgi:hypothetical protein